uniref:Uncharacterized protein n=1 Tax=Pseudonaja textilis TaxID=8673 RepID=A0A670ZVZ3_PSETE
MISLQKLWVTGQKVLEKETIVPSELQSWNFRSVQYQASEDPRGLCSQLHDFCSRWFKADKRTKAQMLDLVVLEQFLALLPLKMENWVRECGVETSSQAVALVEGLFLSQAEEQKEQCISLLWENLLEPIWFLCFPVQEGLVSFKEVAVYFSEEEWSELDPDQKALHWEVMMENYRNVASLEEIPIQILKVEVGEKNQWQTKSEDRIQLNDPRGKNPPFSLEIYDLLAQEDLNGEGMGRYLGCDEIFEEQSNFSNPCEWRQEGNRYNQSCPPHWRDEMGGKAFECKDYENNFNYSGNLVSHPKKPTGENPYKCIECGKSFTRNDKLTAHVRIHTGEKPYKCMECGKSFMSNNILISHKRIHTREKPYKCMECGKSYSHSKSFISHEIIPKGEKPYKCMICGKSFNRCSSFDYHKKIHTGEKPYQCMECRKSFIRNDTLISHKRIHTGEKPFKCLECGKSYSHSSSLISHKMIHKREKKWKELQPMQ